MHRHLLLSLALTSCTVPSEDPALPRVGTVTGGLSSPADGDAWIFLYRPNEGPPGQPAVPVTITAVPAARRTTDPRFVIAQVSPNPYRLWGLVDVDADFDPSIDVLAQPSFGDRVSSGVDFQSQPGRGAVVDLSIDTPIFTEPPAFSVEGEPDQDVLLDPSLNALTPITLQSDPVGTYDSQRVAFTFGLVDANNDGTPDDLNGDGLPDLSLQLFLRWLPLPGQLPAGQTVVAPLAFDPTPFLRTLQGRLDLTVSTQRLQVLMLPQALLQAPQPDGGLALSAFGAPPAGRYELIALAGNGQYWRLPNQLADRVSSQGTRFRIDRVSP